MNNPGRSLENKKVTGLITGQPWWITENKKVTGVITGQPW